MSKMSTFGPLSLRYAYISRMNLQHYTLTHLYLNTVSNINFITFLKWYQPVVKCYWYVSRMLLISLLWIILVTLKFNGTLHKMYRKRYAVRDLITNFANTAPSAFRFPYTYVVTCHAWQYCSRHSVCPSRTWWPSTCSSLIGSVSFAASVPFCEKHNRVNHFVQLHWTKLHTQKSHMQCSFYRSRNFGINTHSPGARKTDMYSDRLNDKPNQGLFSGARTQNFRAVFKIIALIFLGREEFSRCFQHSHALFLTSIRLSNLLLRDMYSVSTNAT